MTIKKMKNIINNSIYNNNYKLILLNNLNLGHAHFISNNKNLFLSILFFKIQLFLKKIFDLFIFNKNSNFN